MGFIWITNDLLSEMHIQVYNDNYAFVETEQPQRCRRTALMQEAWFSPCPAEAGPFWVPEMTVSGE